MSISKPVGLFPTEMLALILFVFPSITDTVFLIISATYILLNKGLTAIPYGVFPTEIVSITLLVIPSITDTVPSSKFVTYIQLAVGFTAIPTGKVFTSMPELYKLGGEEVNDEALALALSVLLFSILLDLGLLSLLLFLLLYPL